MMKRRVFCVGAMSATALLGGRSACAKDDFPNRPIRLVMPYSDGGSGDVVLRPLVARLSASMGQSVVVDYKPGASNVIGSQIVAKAAPDGYTVGFIADSHSINPIINKALPYDSFADFSPISQLVGLPMVLMMSPALGIETLSDLVKYARANPDKLSYASLGEGTAHHLLVEWFRSVSGTTMLHVPFAGVAPGLTALLGGHVHLMFAGPGVALQHMKNKTLNALAITAPSRLAIAPQLPTFVESGFPGYEFTGWYGLVAPAKTPPEIIGRWNQEIAKALGPGELRDQVSSNGFIPSPSSPEEFTAMLRRNAAFYERLMKIANIKVG